MQPKVLISFDVEEFDIPLEYGHPVSMEEQMETGRRGLHAIMPFLESEGIPCTMFTTAHFAETFPADVVRLASLHEIASHSYYHAGFKIEDLAASKQVLENISKKKVTGLRMPRMKKVAMEDVKKAGYLYDSSINPTFIPGRYNNFHIPRTLYTEKEVVRLPVSVSPVLRVPLFWLGFKNYPYPLFLQLCKKTIKRDGYICLYFHPWEFTDIAGYGLPKYISKPDGIVLLNKLKQLIQDLTPLAKFSTIQDFLVLKGLSS